MEFYTILTNIGKAKLANAQIMGQTVNLVQMALGDGNGNYYEPTESQEELVNEVWRGNINQITNDSENPNWIVVETVVPTNQGGFTIREVGIFDDEGDMIAIGKYPETYKPALSEGAGKDLYVRMILEVSNVSTVTLRIDPAVVLASRAYVDAHVGSQINTLKSQIEDGTVVAKNALTIQGHDISIITGTITFGEGAYYINLDSYSTSQNYAYFVWFSPIQINGSTYRWPEWEFVVSDIPLYGKRLAIYLNEPEGYSCNYTILKVKRE